MGALQDIPPTPTKVETVDPTGLKGESGGTQAEDMPPTHIGEGTVGSMERVMPPQSQVLDQYSLTQGGSNQIGGNHSRKEWQIWKRILQLRMRIN